MEIPLPFFLAGFKQSHQRVSLAKNQTDRKQMFIALFEALNWIVSIDDRLRRNEPKWQDQFGNSGEIVRAIRLGRNRVHHQWADIFFYSRQGLMLPVQIPSPLFDYVWIEAKQLPPVAKKFEDREGKALYQQLLENQPVRHSLLQMEGLFDKAIS